MRYYACSFFEVNIILDKNDFNRIFLVIRVATTIKKYKVQVIKSVIGMYTV